MVGCDGCGACGVAACGGCVMCLTICRVWLLWSIGRHGVGVAAFVAVDQSCCEFEWRIDFAQASSTMSDAHNGGDDRPIIVTKRRAWVETQPSVGCQNYVC